MAKIRIKNPMLKSWVALNNALLTADEDLCHKLLKEEKNGRKRLRFLLRIHSRLNKVRADRERTEIKAKI